MHRYLTSENTRGTFEHIIPQTDRQEFCLAYEAGDKRRSYSALDRSSFAKAVNHADVSELVSKDVTGTIPELTKTQLAKVPVSAERTQGASANVADLAIDESLLSELRSAQDTPSKAATDLKQPPNQLKR